MSSTDPFIKMIRQMCTKDKVVQSLYERSISWAEVPSDDDILEMDDWKSCQKMVARAKDSYKNHVTAHKKVYTIPQRTKTKKQCNQIVVASRTPYTLKNRSESIQKEIVEEIVHQTPTDYEEGMDSIVPPSDLPPFILSNEVSKEMVPAKIMVIDKINPTFLEHISSLRSLHLYVFLSIILLYALLMKK